jgi:hypothetical protein
MPATLMRPRVRWPNGRPVRTALGQVVFFRSVFAIVPVVLIYTWRGEIGSDAIAMTNPVVAEANIGNVMAAI